MAEYVRRSWKTDDGDWVERRRRSSSSSSGPTPSLAAPVPVPALDEAGFVRRDFHDHRPRPSAPAAPQAAYHADSSTFSESEKDRCDGHWVRIVGLPRDVCLEARAYMEGRFGPTRAAFIASSAIAAGNRVRAAAGHGDRGRSTGIGAGAGGFAPAAGALHECYVCFENPLHAAQAVRAGDLHFSVARGAAATVATERLIAAYPEAAASLGLTAGNSAYATSSDKMNAAATARSTDVPQGGEEGVTGRLWVHVSIVWSSAQQILSLLQEARGQTEDEMNAAQAIGPSLSRAAAAAAATAPLTSFATSAVADGMNVLDVFLASTMRTKLWLAVPRVLLLLIWTLLNITSRLLCGQGWHRATVSPAAANPSAATAGGSAGANGVPLPPSNLPTSSTAALREERDTLFPAMECAQQQCHQHRPRGRVGGRNHSSRGQRGGDHDGTPSTRTAAALEGLLQLLLQPSIGDPRGTTTPAASLSLTRVCATLFYIIFGSLAPRPRDIDLVLWSWLRMRSPYVQRNRRALRYRLRRLARAFAADRDVDVGVFGYGGDDSSMGSLDPSFDQYAFRLNAQALGWDGAFADFRLYDDDPYHSPYGNQTRYISRESGGGQSLSRNGERGAADGTDNYGNGGGLIGPDSAAPLRVLVTWQPAMWLQRYSVLSTLAMFVFALYYLRPSANL